MDEPGYRSLPVAHSTEYDVVMGRGKRCDGHPGNVAFRSIVRSHRSIYRHATNTHKREIAEHVVNAVVDRQGRFLQRGTNEESNEDCFFVVSWAVAINKTLQALREQSATEPLGDRGPVAAPVSVPKRRVQQAKSRTKASRTPRASAPVARPATVAEPTVAEPTIVESTVAPLDLSLVMEPGTPSVGMDLSNVLDEPVVSDVSQSDIEEPQSDIEEPWMDEEADWMPHGSSFDPEPLLCPPTGVTPPEVEVAASTLVAEATSTHPLDSTRDAPTPLPVTSRPMRSTEDTMVRDTATPTRSVMAPMTPPPHRWTAVTPLTVTSMGPPVGVLDATPHTRHGTPSTNAAGAPVRSTSTAAFVPDDDMTAEDPAENDAQAPIMMDWEFDPTELWTWFLLPRV